MSLQVIYDHKKSKELILITVKSVSFNSWAEKWAVMTVMFRVGSFIPVNQFNFIFTLFLSNWFYSLAIHPIYLFNLRLIFSLLLIWCNGTRHYIGSEQKKMPFTQGCEYLLALYSLTPFWSSHSENPAEKGNKAKGLLISFNHIILRWNQEDLILFGPHCHLATPSSLWFLAQEAPSQPWFPKLLTYSHCDMIEQLLIIPLTSSLWRE